MRQGEFMNIAKGARTALSASIRLGRSRGQGCPRSFREFALDGNPRGANELDGRSMCRSGGGVGRGRRRLGPVLMPFVDFAFCLEPISQVVPRFIAPVKP